MKINYCTLVEMTTIDSEYFHVCKNELESEDFDIKDFIEGLCDYYGDLDIINFGQFSLPVSIISKVDEFLKSELCTMTDYEFIELTESYYLFKACDLYFHITWKVVDDLYVFNILHGVEYSNDEFGVFVYHDDDADTVVPPDYSSDD